MNLKREAEHVLNNPKLINCKSSKTGFKLKLKSTAFIKINNLTDNWKSPIKAKINTYL